MLDQGGAYWVKVHLDRHLAAGAVVGVGDLGSDGLHVHGFVWCCDASMNALFNQKDKQYQQDGATFLNIELREKLCRILTCISHADGGRNCSVSSFVGAPVDGLAEIESIQYALCGEFIERWADFA